MAPVQYVTGAAALTVAVADPGPCRFLCVASETQESWREKRLMFLLAVATWPILLLSLITWNTVAAAAVCAALSSILGVVGLASFVTLKRHDICRDLLVITGVIYSVAMFVSEACLPLRTSEGRLLTLVLPTFLFYVPCGGQARFFFVSSAVHGLLYVIYAIVQASVPSTSRGCFTSAPAALTTNEGALIFVQHVLPCVVIVAACCSIFLQERANQARERERNEWCTSVHSNLRSNKVDAAVAQVDVYGKVAEAAGDPLTESDQFVCDAVRMIAEHVAAAPIRKNSHRQSGVFNNGAVQAAGFTAFGTPVQNDLALTTVTSFTPQARTPEEAAHQVSGRNIDAHGTHSKDQSGEQASRRSNSPMEHPHQDGEVSRRASFRVIARRQSLRNPFVKEAGYVAQLALPHLGQYIAHAAHSTEVVKLVFTQFVDAVNECNDLFGGTTLCVSGHSVIVQFEHCQSACAAATHLIELMNRDRVHLMRDQIFAETVPSTPFCIVVFDKCLEKGIVGTTRSHMIATSPAITVMEALVKFMNPSRSQGEPRPGICVASSLTKLLQEDFNLQPTTNETLTWVLGAKHLSDGLPRYTPMADVDGEDFDLPTVPVTEVSHVPLGRRQSVARAMFSTMTRAPSMSNGSAAAFVESASGPTSEGGNSNGLSEQGSMRKGTTSHGTRRKLPQDVIDLWFKYDVDRNGHLDASEMKDVLNEMGLQLSEEDFKLFFIEVDEDNSGQVTMEEFSKAYYGTNIGGAQVMATIRRAATEMQRNSGGDNLPIVLNAWKKYDSNGSGNLDAMEMHRLLNDLGIAISEEEVHWMVDKLDRNGNGTVDFDEFASLFAEEDSVADNKLNAVRARIQTVTRVMENTNEQTVYSTPDQSLRDARTKVSDWIRSVLWPPLFFYVLYNFSFSSLAVAKGPLFRPALAHAILNFIFDFLYMAWFVCKFVVIPREVHGQVLFKRVEMIKHYVRSTEFVADIITVLPIDIVYFSLGLSAPTAAYGYFRANKVFSIYHLDTFFARMFGSFNPSVIRVMNAVLWFVLVSHVFACLLQFTATFVPEQAWKEMTGVNDFRTNDNTSYLISILWATQMMAGQIKGPALPVYTEQLYLLLITVMCSIPVFAGILSTISTAVTAENTETDFLSKIDSLRGYFQYTNLPQEFEVECVRYYRHLFATTGSMNVEENPLDDLPIELAIPITIEMGLDMLRKVPIFKDACENLQFVHELTSKLAPQVVEPGNVVMRQGERGTNMYFITYGDFNVVTPTGVSVFTLRKGSFFGEIALLHNVKRTATIVCGKDRYANVLMLEKRDFDEVAATFPEALSAISKAAEGRIKQILEKEAEDARKAKEARKAETEKLKALAVAEGRTPPDESLDGNAQEDEEDESPKKGSMLQRIHNMTMRRDRQAIRPETPMTAAAATVKVPQAEK